MHAPDPDPLDAIREEVSQLCARCPGAYRRGLEEYDVERTFRETRLCQVAPISTNLILSYLAEHVLGRPRSS